MTGGDNIGNIKAMYDRETKYVTALGKIRSDLKDILQQPVGYVQPSIRGLIDYIGDLLNE